MERLCLLFLFICATGFSNTAWKYFYPAWELENDKDLPVKTYEVMRLAFDPQHRTEESFTVSDAIYHRVVFWMRIYSQYSSWMKVIHDSRDPRIIYGHIDFTPLYNRKMSRMGREIMKQRIERAVLKRLKLKLYQASRNGRDTETDLIRFHLAQFNTQTITNPSVYARRLRSQMGQRDMFLLALHRSPELLKTMEDIFKSKGLPGGLTRLPFVESSFNPDAKSKSGAMGIWQFMPRTARAYIHKKSEILWRDSMEQTYAAAHMLRMNRGILPDWGMTVTSYNSGVGRLHRLIRQHGFDSVDSLLASKRIRLGFAGRNFYSEFLAALLVESYKDYLFPEASKTREPAWAFMALLPITELGCSP